MGRVIAKYPPLGEELVPPGEEAAIQTVADVCAELMDDAARPVARQQHSKGHGCVRARFVVAPDVHADLRHGILATPRGFDAIIRFSNGRQTDDRNKDAHGLAMKLFGVTGPKVLDATRDATTQDLVFMDHGTFFIRDALDYAEFATALRNGTRRSRSRWLAPLGSKVQALVVGVHLFRKFFLKHSAEKGFIQKVRSAPPVSPLQSRYFSVTPAKLGPHAVRWSLDPRPLSAPIAPGPSDDGEHRLRAAMVRHLRQQTAAFEVYVQRQTDPVTMPVEDPTVAWDELVSPRYRVGTIEIPVQEFDTPHKRASGDALAFTNWHCLPEHRPLGGISRVRRAVYDVTAARRRALNGQPTTEPADDWLNAVWESGAAKAPGSAERSAPGPA